MNILKSDVELLIEKKLGFKSAKITNTGSEAIKFALINAKIAKGTYIVLPVTICKSVVDVVLEYGCFPLFCDVDNEFCLNYNLINFNSKNISVILYVHAYGILKDISKLVLYCKKYNKMLIEDSAQYICESDKNQKLAHGDYIIFSFGQGKPISIGMYGLLASNNFEIGSYPVLENEKYLSDLNKKFLNLDKILTTKTRKVERYMKYLSSESILLKNKNIIDNQCHRLLYKQMDNYYCISDKMYEFMKENSIENFQSTILIEAFREENLKGISQCSLQNLDLDSFPNYNKLKNTYYYFRTCNSITFKSIDCICKKFNQISKNLD